MARHVVVMGVAGSGKTTIGRELAERLGMTFVEGDRLHPESNIAKMSAGQPLDDDDRRPWLVSLAALTAAYDADGTSTVVSCSALRRSYRDLLRTGLPAGSVFFVHLDAPPAVLRARMESRQHFMPASLLQSQVEALEPLGADESGAVFDVSAPVDAVVEAVRVALPHPGAP